MCLQAGFLKIDDGQHICPMRMETIDLAEKYKLTYRVPAVDSSPSHKTGYIYVSNTKCRN
jgi:hypothetical protein